MSFSSVSFDFQVQRRPEFSLLSLCIPILFLGILNSCVFLIPASSGERISYAITVLLSFAVFLTIISANMPKNSDPVPILGYVLMVLMVESGIIVFLTIYSLRLHFRSDSRPIPRLMRISAKLLGKKFGKTSPKTTITENGTSRNNDPETTISSASEEQTRIGCGACESWQTISDIFDKVCFWVSFLVFLITIVAYMISVKSNT